MNIGHFIDGKRVGGTSQRRGDVFDPATGRRTAAVELASTADVDVAVHGNVLRMGPPLTLTEEEAREGLAILVDAIRSAA
ncbi:hypothetical protein JNW90_27690, partial [Micromonospora sp. STR1s_5]|nr:hypothetical protein [Micromonospora sp. STR1s_5]